jgi:methylmalonyl-CoA mutase N-terminal domain/subunit
MKRGIEIDRFAPRIHSYFRVGNDLFEEVAKFRALRRMWARMMREEFGAKDPRSLRMRVHVQSLGPTFTAQQPLNNLVRGTIHTLAASLGGVQSLAVDTYDEALSTPSDVGKVLSLRTQQIVEHESGIVNVADPLGGSYYVEWLTNKMEEEAQKIIDKLEELGGACKIKACSWFLPQKREAAYKRQKEIDGKKRIVVGVNEYVMDEKDMLSTFVPEVLDFDYQAMYRKQIERLNKVRRERDNAKVEQAKKMLYEAFKEKVNMMPPMIEAVKTYISAGEIMKVLMEARGPQYGPRGENTIEKEIELGLFNFD